MERLIQTQEELQQLTALQSGSSVAFKYFYDRYSPQLYRKLLKMVRIQEIAEELLQDLFLKVWEKRESIDQQQSFTGYLYRIAEHMVIDYFRKSANEAKRNREFALTLNEIYNPVEELIQVKEAEKQIDIAISKLPDMQRQVFTLCKLEGKTYDQVSELLGISKATINTHITRATKSIKAQLLEGDQLALLLLVTVSLTVIH